MRTLPTQDSTTCTTYLLVEHGLGLTTVPALLPVVTTLPLRKLGGLPSLVLGHLVKGVLLAVLRRAEGVPGLRHNHLWKESMEKTDHERQTGNEMGAEAPVSVRRDNVNHKSTSNQCTTQPSHLDVAKQAHRSAHKKDHVP